MKKCPRVNVWCASIIYANVRFYNLGVAALAAAAKVRFPPILWKNNVLRAQKVAA